MEECKKISRKFTALYSGVQFEYYVIMNALASFTSVFLVRQGYHSSDVGMVLGIATFLSVFLQPIVSDFVDNTKKYMISDIIVFCDLIMMVLTVGLLVLHGRSMLLSVIYVAVLVVMYILLPLTTQLNYEYEHAGIKMNFGIARAFGSIGFSFTAWLLGRLVDSMGVSSVPWCAMFGMITLLLTLKTLNRNYKNLKQGDLKVEHEEELERITLKQFAKDHKTMMVMFFGSMLMIVHLMVYCTYMYQFMEAIGGNASDMGNAIAVMAIVEVPVLMNYQKLEDRFSAKTLMQVSLIGFLLKNVGFLVAKTTTALILVQITQALGFALYTPASISFIHDHTRRQEETKGQGVAQSVFTAAGIIGNFVGGYMIDAFGCGVTIKACSILTVIGAIIVYVASNRVKAVQK